MITAGLSMNDILNTVSNDKDYVYNSTCNDLTYNNQYRYFDFNIKACTSHSALSLLNHLYNKLIKNIIAKNIVLPKKILTFKQDSFINILEGLFQS